MLMAFEGLTFTVGHIEEGKHSVLHGDEGRIVVRIVNSGFTGMVLVIIEEGDSEDIHVKRVSIEEAEKEFNIELK